MVAESGEEAVGGGTRSVGAGVGVDVVVVILPDVRVHGGRAAIGVVIIADSGDEVGVPALDQVGYVSLLLARRAEVSNHGKRGRRAYRGGRCAEKRVHGGSGGETEAEHQNREEKKDYYSG